MKERIISKWDEIMENLITQHELTNTAVNSWIRPLQIQSINNNTVTFYYSEDERVIGFIKSKYYDVVLATAIEQVTGLHVKIEFTNVMEENKSNTEKKKDDFSKTLYNGLNPRYTFDTFVVGQTNKMAHAISIAVSDAPGQSNNPLFLYGGAGLGKTHLMHSIAHKIIKERPELKVIYVTSEQFTIELIDSLQHNRNNEFREKYRNIDVLLIDDIQFIIGKENTQEEFFHTFNELYNANKQIVISSDKHPKEITTLEERLRSRFQWGITVDIQPPDFETKMAILKNKANIDHIPVDQDVLEYVAVHITSNIRELEGALNTVFSYSKIQNSPITIDLAEQALKDTIETQHEITPELIIDIVADYFNITKEDIISKKKNREIAEPRQICMYLSRQYTDASLQLIGRALGGRDHTTVIHGHDKIAVLIKNDDIMRLNIDSLVNKITPQK